MLANHKEARLQFAREFVNWQGSQWQNIAYFDETTIYSNYLKKRRMSRGKGKKEAFHPRYTKKKNTKKFKVNLVCVILPSKNYISVRQVDGNLNSEKYCDILNELLPEINDLIFDDLQEGQEYFGLHDRK